MTLVLGLGAAAMTVNRPSDRGLFPDGADADPDRAEANPAAALQRLVRDRREHLHERPLSMEYT